MAENFRFVIHRLSPSARAEHAEHADGEHYSVVMKRVDNLEVSPPKMSVSEQQERLYRKFPHRT
ncbi:MAG: hypothetical protein Q4G38_04270, partial [Aeriscardovia aeriphila]|nr:hypothetical protein [Aeriscardovia aeriphila]